MSSIGSISITASLNYMLTVFHTIHTAGSLFLGLYVGGWGSYIISCIKLKMENYLQELQYHYGLYFLEGNSNFTLTLMFSPLDSYLYSFGG